MHHRFLPERWLEKEVFDGGQEVAVVHKNGEGKKKAFWRPSCEICRELLLRRCGLQVG
jgi:hypothetical protein